MDAAKAQKSKDESTLNQSPEVSQEPSPVVVRREPDRDIIVWTAPARFFRKRDRRFYVTIFAMAGIVSLVIFLAEGIMPVILIISLVFLYYVLATVKPNDIEYKITNKGIKIAGSLVDWQNIKRFWFTERAGTELLMFDTLSITGKIEIVINRGLKENLKKEISAYIPFEETPPTSIDKVTNWFSKKLPGNE